MHFRILKMFVISGFLSDSAQNSFFSKTPTMALLALPDPVYWFKEALLLMGKGKEKPTGVERDGRERNMGRQGKQKHSSINFCLRPCGKLRHFYQGTLINCALARNYIVK